MRSSNKLFIVPSPTVTRLKVTQFSLFTGTQDELSSPASSQSTPCAMHHTVFDTHCCHMGRTRGIKQPVPDRVKPSFVIFDIRALGRSGLSVRTLRAERQSARMSKITNDGLTRSGTGCCTCIAVPTWQQWTSMG